MVRVIRPSLNVIETRTEKKKLVADVLFMSFWRTCFDSSFEMHVK